MDKRIRLACEVVVTGDDSTLFKTVMRIVTNRFLSILRGYPGDGMTPYWNIGNSFDVSVRPRLVFLDNAMGSLELDCNFGLTH